MTIFRRNHLFQTIIFGYPFVSFRGCIKCTTFFWKVPQKVGDFGRFFLNIGGPGRGWWCGCFGPWWRRWRGGNGGLLGFSGFEMEGTGANRGTCNKHPFFCSWCGCFNSIFHEIYVHEKWGGFTISIHQKWFVLGLPRWMQMGCWYNSGCSSSRNRHHKVSGINHFW